MYEAYKGNENVVFYLVYVREIHPVAKSALAPGEKPKDPKDVAQAKNLDERILTASACMEGLKLTLPVLIDTMEGTADKAYSGVPSTTAVINTEGNVVFHSIGPGGSQPKKAEEALKKLGLEPAPAKKPASQPASKPS
ncbi:MAG: hypothetical protein HZA50_13320 [Planctomycetes bacterium]|nr:hypothetical protein [Planctomycetota bacterium]